MRRSSILLLTLALGTAALSGCNYDPETRLFRQVAPKPEDVVLQPPGAEVQASESGDNTVEQGLDSCDEDSLRCHAQNIATNLNALTIGLLTIVDEVLQFPPSHRETGRRVWGPHLDPNNGNTFRFEMSREDDGSFAWCVHVGAGDLRLASGMVAIRCEDETDPNGMMRLLSGNLEASDVDGEAARSGSGSMLLEAVRLLELQDDPELLGTFSFVYDNTNGREIEIDITDLPAQAGNPFGSDVLYQYKSTLEGSGTFGFAARANFVGDGGGFGFASVPEDFVITAQWQADKAGRADARISGGDLPENQSYTATQCWDTTLVTTYSGNTYDATQTVGDVDDCVFRQSLLPDAA